ncbi:UDP-N-acetylmuramate dehydrogenase [Synechococcus sp. A15-28]|uniref:UDP-N-acetylmuramate dehydrogenase n=1 Tax=Synechococcus sp. A15-28 TaxID=1050638 RepID=UPI00164898C5|nr:UDP-N-acetylmuramate dehydrogenase [Synechococcus sp. A15-28]
MLSTNIPLRSNVPLADFTTWRVGGPAQWLLEPTTVNDTLEALQWAQHNQIPCRVIGAGSNLLIHDDGLPGLTLSLRKLQGATVDADSGVVEALAGEPIPTLARRAARAGLDGLAWSVGIPGTVGGAAVMNAGAQGGCTADCLESVRVAPLEGGESFELGRDQLAFDYRHSRLQEEELVVLSARFRLDPGHDPDEITRITSGNLSHRTSTQPYTQPSCGSVFRNPEPLKAGRLIEGLGLKGSRIGGAEVSTLHANFIVNTGAATAADIDQLIQRVLQQVEAAHAVRLHPEVKRLGFTGAA